MAHLMLSSAASCCGSVGIARDSMAFEFSAFPLRRRKGNAENSNAMESLAMPTEPQQLAAEDNIRCAMPNQMRPFALEPGAGTSVLNPVGGRLVFKLRGEQSNGAMTVFETVAVPKEGPPLHFHQLQDEWLYVLEGEMRIRLGDDIVPAPAGSCAFIPRRVAHTWQNSGRKPALLLAMFAPSGLEQFFERYAELTDQAGDLDTFRALAPEAGMTVVVPPLAQSHPTYTGEAGVRIRSGSLGVSPRTSTYVAT